MTEPTAFSTLADRDVGTSSEEWRHECEIAYLAAMPIAKRNTFLDGVPGTMNREERGIRGVRGEAAVVKLRSEIARFEDIARNRKGPAPR